MFQIPADQVTSNLVYFCVDGNGDPTGTSLLENTVSPSDAVVSYVNEPATVVCA